MSNITVNIKRLDPTVELPKYAHPTDAGLDLRSNEDCVLKPFERRLVFYGAGHRPARWLRRLRSAPQRLGHQAGPVYSTRRVSSTPTTEENSRSSSLT